MHHVARGHHTPAIGLDPADPAGPDVPAVPEGTGVGVGSILETVVGVARVVVLDSCDRVGY